MRRAVSVVLFLILVLFAGFLFIDRGRIFDPAPAMTPTEKQIQLCAMGFSNKPDATEAEGDAEEKVFFKCMSDKGYEFRPRCQSQAKELGQKPDVWDDECYIAHDQSN